MRCNGLFSYIMFFLFGAIVQQSSQSELFTMLINNLMRRAEALG